MKILDGEILPSDTVAVEGDLKEGEMKFEREPAKAARP